MRQKSGCGSTVADRFAGPFRRLSNHLCAEIFFRILKLNFLGDAGALQYALARFGAKLKLFG